MKRVLPILLALVLMAGCATKIPCNDYSSLAANLKLLPLLLPEGTNTSLLKRCYLEVKAQSVLCGLGEPTDADIYNQCLDYSINAVKAALALEQNTPVEAPNPAPKPTTPPTPSPTPISDQRDEIDPAIVQWVGDLSVLPEWPWPIKYDLVVSFSGNDVVLQQEGTSHWPIVNGTVGNPIVIAQIDGKWKGGNFEWFRKGATHRAKRAVAGDHIKAFHDIPAEWRPSPGQKICFTVAALNRGRFQGKWTWEYNRVYERTPIKCVVWQ